MGNLPLFFGGGMIIGIGLFFVCERAGWLHKWSGLKPPPRPQDASSEPMDKMHHE